MARIRIRVVNLLRPSCLLLILGIVKLSSIVAVTTRVLEEPWSPTLNRFLIRFTVLAIIWAIEAALAFLAIRGLWSEQNWGLILGITAIGIDFSSVPVAIATGIPDPLSVRVLALAFLLSLPLALSLAVVFANDIYLQQE